MSASIRTLSLAIVLFSCLASMATPALSQEKTREKVTLTQQQAELNNRAVLLLKEDPPRAEEAIDLIQAAMRLGPQGDLLVLTMGRAHYLDGQCDKAKEYYDQTADAPEVDGLPQAFVSIRLDKYRQEMRETCPGELAITCSAPDIDLTLEDKALACNETVEMPAGSYTINASRESTGAKISVQTNVIGMETTELKIDLGEPAVTPPEKTDTGDGNGDTGVGDKTEIEPEPEPKNSLLTANVGVPFGLCLAQVFEIRGQSTGNSVCGGVKARITERYAISETLAIGGTVGGSFIGAAPNLSGINYTAPLTLSLDAGFRLWPIPALALELFGQVRAESIEYGTVEEYDLGNSRASDTLLGQAGLGANLELDRLVSALPPISLGARWSPVLPDLYLNAWSLGASVRVWKLNIDLTFERWGGSALSSMLDEEGNLVQERDSDNTQERVLLGISYHFEMPH